MEYIVSPSGDDNNPGTLNLPFRTINQGIGKLVAGDILSLRQGTYVETVTISQKIGAENDNIVIRSFPGEHACIDGSLPQFRALDDNCWRLASLDDPKAHADEYISTETFANAPNDPVNRGVFLDYHPYTRLITYSNLNDFRSDNETFDLITDYPKPDLREGPAVMEKCGEAEGKQNPACLLFQDGSKYKPGLARVQCAADDPDPNCKQEGDKKFKFVRYRRPWVYMGPGLWFDRDAHKLHIRFSHTHNNVPGLVDYVGETDPNKIRLAISSKLMITLCVLASEHVRFENLTIRFGGQETIFLSGSRGVVFDHVRIRAGGYGVRMAATDTVFRHCEFDGGLPTWYFRTDRKAGYFFVADGEIVENSLGAGTLDVLLLGNPNDTGTHVHHCEFHDGHDIYLHGANLTFHHNWIYNLNDEGLFLDAGKTTDLQSYQMNIFQNVITKTQSAISFAGSHTKGNWYIYRNLIDLRSPTAGFRPRSNGDQQVWRFGQAFKISGEDGPRDLFQNTFLVHAQNEQASYLHYRDTTKNQPRRTFNNIFVAVNPDINSDKAITFVPSPSFPGPTDGNNYHRIGARTRPLFRFLEYCFKDDPPCPQVPIKPPPAPPPCPADPTNDRKCGAGTFADLAALKNSLLFQQSKSQYTPGYEANSIEADPRFRRLGAEGVFHEADDLRLDKDNASPAIRAGVVLPDDLRLMDPFAPTGDNPDIGCYPLGSCPLQVGVDSRRSFPIE